MEKQSLLVCGFLVTLFAFIISFFFFPTTSCLLHLMERICAILIISFLVVLTIPFIIFQLTKSITPVLLDEDENAKEIHK